MDNPVVLSHDPGDGSATCPDPQSHPVSLLEGQGGGGRPRRGRPEGGDLKYPTGVGGGPPGLVPRPSRWLVDLSRPSVPLGNAARWLRGVWQLWGAAPCAHVRRPVGRPSALKCEGAPGEISGAFCGPICWSHLYCGVASLKQGQEMAREAICSELDDPNFRYQYIHRKRKDSPLPSCGTDIYPGKYILETFA